MIFIKKIKDLSPLIVAVIIVMTLIVLFATGAFDKPKETTITSSTLEEVIKTAELSTAKYVQHGIAKAHIDGKEDTYILYYATVKPKINFEDIKYEIDEDSMKIIVTVPKTFTFVVELLDDEEHNFYYYPKKPDGWTIKEVKYVCATHAKQKADENDVLLETARESLENTIETLLSPLVSSHGYTVEIISDQGV